MTPKIVVQPVMKSSNADDQAQLRYLRFGWRKLRFGGILSRPVTAYVVLCLCTFIQNFSVNGANNAVISTLERVFYLDSVQSGLFLALYDLATVFSSPVVGYLGSRYSSPIFFSLNMIIVGIGNMLIASSNFIHQDNSLNFNSQLVQEISSYNNVLFQCYKDPLNERNITDVACLKREKLSSNIQQAKAILYLGNFVNGIGSVALFTVGIAYIERIFPKEKAAYCQGIYFAVGTVGGALGIVVTGRFLQLFTKLTPKRRLPSWLTPSHPLWIGCWWLPYIIYGSLCLLVGLFVSGLPNFEEPGKKDPIALARSNQPSELHLNTNVPTIQEDNPTTVTTVVSRPPTPHVQRDLFLADSNSKSEPILVSLKPNRDEYRLSNRRLRQLSPLELIAKKDSSLAVESSEEGFINHAFSSEFLHNQLAISNSSVSPTLTATDSTASPPSTTPDSSVAKTSRQVIGENFKHMCSVIGELLRNPRYVFIIIASLFEGILIKGFVPFITKYFEYQHQLDTSTATTVTGAIALVSVIIGCPIGAYLINRFSWTPMQCARACCVVFLISSFLFLFLTLTCPELKFQQTVCSNANAVCCHNVYHPVCQVDHPNLMYLSPCHYGCVNQTTIESNNTNFYSSCDCAMDQGVTLSETVCRFRRIPCVLVFTLTMAGAALVVFFTALIQVPLLQVLLYSVPLSYQSMALGLRQTIVRVLGQTTGPLLYGFAFDQTCLVWLTDCYGRRTCKVYDNRRMGLSLALAGFGTRLISGIACGFVFLHWKFAQADAIIPAAN